MIFKFVESLRCFVPKLVHVAARLKMKLRKRLTKTFDGFADEEISALEMQKVNFVEALVLALLCLKGNYTVGAEACNTQIAWVLQRNLTDLAIQWYIGFLL